jgi:hypothetical protein
MNFINYVWPLSVATFILCCNPKKEHSSDLAEVRDIVVTSVEYEPPPPPPPPLPNTSSNFRSIQSWLSHICEQEESLPPGLIFHFGVFHNEAGITLYFYGDGEENQDTGKVKKPFSFYPKEMYYILPKEKQFASKEKSMEIMTKELKQFVQSDKFLQCFFQNARAITTEWAGNIWSNPQP